MSKSEEIQIFAIITAKPGKEDELRAALAELIPITQAEPGCLHYILHEDIKTPGSFYFYEVFKDQAAVKAHSSAPHFTSAFAKVAPLLGGPATVVQTRHVAGA